METINYKDDWKDFFDQESKKDYFQKILKLINTEYKKHKLYPRQEDIFKVFQLCSFKDIKIIFLGQDPYHTPNVANGLAFSVNNTLNYTPPSLRNIFKELEDDLGVKRKNTDLSDWVEQGVFLINTILTVYEGKPLSCNNWGWETFILNFIDYLNQSNKKYVYVLLGNNAKKYIKYINTAKDEIVVSSHPSPLSYSKGFKGSRIFTKIDEKIKKINKESIKW